MSKSNLEVKGIFLSQSSPMGICPFPATALVFHILKYNTTVLVLINNYTQNTLIKRSSKITENSNKIHLPVGSITGVVIIVGTATDVVSKKKIFSCYQDI